MSLDDRTAFGEMTVASYEPLAAWAFTHNINPSLVRTSVLNGGTVTHNENMAVCNSGTDPAGEAKIFTIRGSRYTPGIGGKSIFTILFSTPQENSSMGIGPLNQDNGWAVAYNGVRIGIMRRSKGAEEWFYKTRDGRELGDIIDPSKGNVYQIRYQWLGFGAQRLYVENKVGELEAEIDLFYTNEFVETSVDNVNLPITMFVKNDGNTTPIWCKSPSASLGLEGDAFNDALSVNIAEDVFLPGASGIAVPVIAFRLSDTYLGKSNHLFAQALRLLVASEGNKPVTIRAYSGVTLTGGAWNYLSEQISPLEVNKTFTSISGGILIGSYPLGKAATLEVDLTNAKFRIYPGQIIAVMADTGATFTSELRAAVNWRQFL